MFLLYKDLHLWAYYPIITYLLTDEPSLGAFISRNLFLIITSSPAQAAADLTSSSERPYFDQIETKWDMLIYRKQIKIFTSVKNSKNYRKPCIKCTPNMRQEKEEKCHKPTKLSDCIPIKLDEKYWINKWNNINKTQCKGSMRCVYTRVYCRYSFCSQFHGFEA